jgi:putative DNA primase/helicase
MKLHDIPEKIKQLKRFVLWRLEAAGKDSHLTKVPYTRRGHKASTTRPQTWCSFDEALDALQNGSDVFSGIGIVLGDGIMGIDLDGVINEDGDLSREAAEIVEEVPGYVEVSPSGTGLHILTVAKLPDDRDKLKFKWVEFYDETSPRYLTLTANVWEGRSELNEEDASDAVAYVYRRVRDSKEDGLVDRIRKSKQGEKFAALYDRGDWKAYYKSPSEGVMALLEILAWWTRKDKKRMDGIFRKSALYNREKWDRPQCGRTLGAIEIDSACEYVKEVPVDFPDIGSRGGIKPTLENLRALLEYKEIRLCYNEIKKEIKIMFKDGNSYSSDNESNAALARLLSAAEENELPTAHIREYIVEIADQNRVNPVKDWILSKPWDGTDRLLSLFDTVVTLEDYPCDLKELLICKWLRSAVAAAFHQGESFAARGVLTFAGPQYIGKTRWIASLAPPQWVICGRSLDPANKDSVRTAISHWICELGELESTFRRDMGRLKGFLSLGQDQFRVPYAIEDSKYPRRTVFAASVNEPDFLIDPTGNSRFWVVPVIRLDYEHGIDMQQLFAQIRAEGGQWWLTPEENERLEKMNERHKQRDEVYDLLHSKIEWRETDAVEWLTPTEVLISRCKIDRPSKTQRNSCAKILRELTGLKEGRRMNNKGAARYPVPI